MTPRREPAWKAIAALKRGDPAEAIVYLSGSEPVSDSMRRALAAYLDGKFRRARGAPTKLMELYDWNLVRTVDYVLSSQKFSQTERGEIIASAAEHLNISPAAVKARVKKMREGK